jgi:hypothetical protein
MKTQLTKSATSSILVNFIITNINIKWLHINIFTIFLLGLDMGFGSFDWDHSQMNVHFNSNLGFLPAKCFPTV